MRPDNGHARSLEPGSSRASLDEAPEVHALAERSGITLRQARELLNRYRDDQRAIDRQIELLKDTTGTGRK